MLTTTSFKNRLIYIGLIGAFAFFAGYWLFLQKPSSVNRLEQNAFELNYSAFQNGIRLANYRHIVRSATREQSNKTININGLAFNNQGFPVSVASESIYKTSPATAEDCLAIWQKVLGPLQPEMTLSAQKSRYWVDIDVENVCIFRNNRLNNRQIEYDAVKGIVSIVVING